MKCLCIELSKHEQITQWGVHVTLNVPATRARTPNICQLPPTQRFASDVNEPISRLLGPSEIALDPLLALTVLEASWKDEMTLTRLVIRRFTLEFRSAIVQRDHVSSVRAEWFEKCRLQNRWWTSVIAVLGKIYPVMCPNLCYLPLITFFVLYSFAGWFIVETRNSSIKSRQLLSKMLTF